LTPSSALARSWRYPATRPLLRVADFQVFLAEHTYNGRDRVR
jgi:hypothetical protein